MKFNVDDMQSFTYICQAMCLDSKTATMTCVHYESYSNTALTDLAGANEKGVDLVRHLQPNSNNSNVGKMLAVCETCVPSKGLHRIHTTKKKGLHGVAGL
jgi:hypothetical protein